MVVMAVCGVGKVLAGMPICLIHWRAALTDVRPGEPKSASDQARLDNDDEEIIQIGQRV